MSLNIKFAVDFLLSLFWCGYRGRVLWYGLDLLAKQRGCLFSLFLALVDVFFIIKIIYLALS